MPPQKRRECNCQQYCKGGKMVSSRTWFLHAQFRGDPDDPHSLPSSSAAGLQSQNTKRKRLPDLPEKASDHRSRGATPLRQGLGDGGNEVGGDGGDGGDGDGDGDEGDAAGGHGGRGGEGLENEGSDSGESDSSSRNGGGEGDGGDDGQAAESAAVLGMQDAALPVGVFYAGEIRQALLFIDLLQKATLDNTGLDKRTIERLRDPPCTPVATNDPDLLFSLRLLLANEKSSQDTYNRSREAVLLRYPESAVLTHFRAKSLAAELSGVSAVTHDMCVNSCIGFTGPFAELDSCPECHESRYDPISLQASGTKVSRQKFHTIPIGPSLQALWRSPESATSMKYRRENTRATLEAIRQSQGVIDSYSDYIHGEEYLHAVQDGRISEYDMVLMLSVDGAQLYRSKQSDCWIFIWVILDLAPESRYKKRDVPPAAIVPGPNKPKVFDSFMFPTLAHLAALQKEGLPVWDASTDTKFISHPFFALATADSPAMVYLDGLVGHQGAQGCRNYCGTKGRRKPASHQYYPALLKPIDYAVDGCLHGDIDPSSIPPASVAEYDRNLAYLKESPNETQYKTRRRDTGIARPCLISGLSARHRFDIPLGFPGDLMHLLSLNIPDLMLGLWRGTIDCDRTDDRDTWDWAVLRKSQVWSTHGETVRDAKPYIPPTFGSPPRNPAEKINSGYKAKEFSTYLYVLGPGVFYRVLPDKYWRNFCKLVYAVRILQKQKITTAKLVDADAVIKDYVIEFERLYYQRRVDRLHFCRPSLHSLLHIAAEVHRVGPGVCHAQWTMERTIGNLGEEIKSPSKPYANLSQRAVQRAQLNALAAMVPGFDTSNVSRLPRYAVDIGDGFVLLRARDRRAQALESATMAEAICSHFNASPQPIARWARLRLPNGDVARSAWKECLKPLGTGQRARNIKALVDGVVVYGEVQFYFQRQFKGKSEAFALLSLYSEPNMDLYEASHKTLYACKHHKDRFRVISAKTIVSVVGMIPLQTYTEGELFYVAENIRQDIVGLMGSAQNEPEDEE
ncbi:hypothetical protein BOTBODRAFT_160772 [Botryobasidium botryosum FD-172 SS1]|uniref:Uncharacterized protein n=1 Tax=Botryobasidium botryosum (strain FD-172 SS1) TaxID=930990 RepID=A0A067MC63_BOTB1|nr:hypothetical protein BOTBODRAFT_160772 [Botryobasidium botryosum FD-172 SS1]